MRIFGELSANGEKNKESAPPAGGGAAVKTAVGVAVGERRFGGNGHDLHTLFAPAGALHMQGKPEEALINLEKARKGGENLAEIYSAMAQIYLERKQHAEAAKAYRDL